ncbi:MAG: hypothetical protein KF708_14140 [Pirellulales bacterium]|nr:hypothetical protein [Pirellulales bacterium]
MSNTMTRAEAVSTESPWATLLGQMIVLDLHSPYVYLGRLEEVVPGFLVLAEADAHDLRDTATTRDRYIRERCELGVNANRRRVWVRLDEVVGISRLDDVVTD